MLGWGLDAYDYVAYAFVAPILRDLFFSFLGPLASLLATLASFSLSLAVRPLVAYSSGTWLIGLVDARYFTSQCSAQASPAS